MQKHLHFVFLQRAIERSMTSGWPWAPYFRSYGRELVSKPEISLGKSWGGYRRMILLKNSVFGGDLNLVTTGNVFWTKLL